MALINCPECSKEISSLSKSCPNCGYPIAEISLTKTVKIKLPNIELGTVGLFSSRRAIITDNTDKILWEGQHGQTAIFEIDSPRTITIDLGKWVNSFGGNIEPNKKYMCVQDMGMHWKAVYRLSEVDVIDTN